MKLRIYKNSVRLRLSQTEVKLIGEGKPVEESLVFPGGQVFSYLLHAMDTEHNISVQFVKNTLRVSVASPLAASWAHSEQVGLEATLENTDNGDLFILIEKDFQCLHKRPSEDESDNFPNPELK